MNPKFFRCANCHKLKTNQRIFWPIPGEPDGTVSVAVCLKCFAELISKIDVRLPD